MNVSSLSEFKKLIANSVGISDLFEPTKTPVLTPNISNPSWTNNIISSFKYLDEVKRIEDWGNSGQFQHSVSVECTPNSSGPLDRYLPLIWSMPAEVRFAKFNWTKNWLNFAPETFAPNGRLDISTKKFADAFPLLSKEASAYILTHNLTYLKNPLKVEDNTKFKIFSILVLPFRRK